MSCMHMSGVLNVSSFVFAILCNLVFSFFARQDNSCKPTPGVKEKIGWGFAKCIYIRLSFGIVCNVILNTLALYLTSSSLSEKMPKLFLKANSFSNIGIFIENNNLISHENKHRYLK